MSMFRDALNIGINTAKLVKENQKQIDSVIRAVDQEVRAVSEGKVAFVSNQKAMIKQRIDWLGLDANGTNTTTSDLYLIKVDDAKKFIPVGHLLRSSNGYPCVVKFASENIQAMDESSLSQAMGEMLANPGTGTALLTLMDA